METTERLVLSPVPGTCGKLWASECGRIFGVRKEITPERTKHGYLRAIYYDSLAGRSRKVPWHRAVLSAHTGTSDLQVNHKDGDKANNSLDNLEWVTQSTNMKHAEELGPHNGRRKIIT